LEWDMAQGEVHRGYSEWKKTWTKEEFERMQQRLPMPLIPAASFPVGSWQERDATAVFERLHFGQVRSGEIEPSQTPTDYFHYLLFWLGRSKKDLSRMDAVSRLKKFPFYLAGTLAALVGIAAFAFSSVVLWPLRQLRHPLARWSIMLAFLPVAAVLWVLGLVFTCLWLIATVARASYFWTSGSIEKEGLRIKNRSENTDFFLPWEDIGLVTVADYLPYEGAHVHRKAVGTVIVHMIDNQKLAEVLKAHRIQMTLKTGNNFDFDEGDPIKKGDRFRLLKDWDPDARIREAVPNSNLPLRSLPSGTVLVAQHDLTAKAVQVLPEGTAQTGHVNPDQGEVMLLFYDDVSKIFERVK